GVRARSNLPGKVADQTDTAGVRGRLPKTPKGGPPRVTCPPGGGPWHNRHERTVVPMPETIRNPQAENIFNGWGLSFELISDFPIENIQDITGQQVRDRRNIANPDVVQEYY